MQVSSNIAIPVTDMILESILGGVNGQWSQ